MVVPSVTDSKQLSQKWPNSQHEALHKVTQWPDEWAKYLSRGGKGDFDGFQKRTSEQFSEGTLLGFCRRDKLSEFAVGICRAVREARQMSNATADWIVRLHKVCSCLFWVVTSVSPSFCIREAEHSGSQEQTTWRSVWDPHELGWSAKVCSVLSPCRTAEGKTWDAMAWGLTKNS